jgi:hypothetical protein
MAARPDATPPATPPHRPPAWRPACSPRGCRLRGRRAPTGAGWTRTPGRIRAGVRAWRLRRHGRRRARGRLPSACHGWRHPDVPGPRRPDGHLRSRWWLSTPDTTKRYPAVSRSTRAPRVLCPGHAWRSTAQSIAESVRRAGDGLGTNERGAFRMHSWQNRATAGARPSLPRASSRRATGLISRASGFPATHGGYDAAHAMLTQRAL